MDRRRWFAGALGVAMSVALGQMRLAPDATPEPDEAPGVALPEPREAPATSPTPDLPDAQAPTGDRQTIRCPLPIDIGDGRVKLTIESPDAPVITQGSIQAGVLEFQSFGPDGAGLVELPGYERAALVWFQASSGPDCLFPDDPVPRPLGSVSVTFPESEHPLEIEVAGRTFPVEGGLAEVELPEGTHRIRICEQAPYGFRCSPRSEVTVPDDARVDLELQANDVGGLGVAVHPDARTFTFIQVVPGSIADLAGIRPGDRALSIDGEPAHVGADAAWDALSADTDRIELEIERYDGGREVMVLER